MASLRQPRITLKRNALAVTLFEEQEAVCVFDMAGRLASVWKDNRLFRRALDGRIMEKRTDRTGRRPYPHRRFLDEPERRAVVEGAAAAAREALCALQAGRAELIGPSPGTPVTVEAGESLFAASRFDAQASEEDARRFAAAYTSVPILPPDRYRSLVVQVTEGCHWNRCTFCSFYRGMPFRIKGLDEFASHLESVKAFFGEGISLRQGVFLGDANALLLPARELLARLDLLAASLPGYAGDAAAFVDVFTGSHRTAADLTSLKARGLRGIYLGLESGDDGLIGFLNKPQSAAGAVSLARMATAAGVRVGVIVMAGIGGATFQERHLAATGDALASMALGSEDIVYVSAFRAPPSGPYADRALAAGVRPLEPGETERQVELLLEAARRATQGRARVVRYDIAEFIY